MRVLKKTKRWEDLTLVDKLGGTLMSGDAVNLKTSDGKHYLSVDSQSTIVHAKATQAGRSETFTILSTTGKKEITFGDTIAFRTYQNMFISAGNRSLNTIIRGNKRSVGIGETFKLLSPVGVAKLMLKPITPPASVAARPPASIARTTPAPGAVRTTDTPTLELAETVGVSAKSLVAMKALTPTKKTETEKKNLNLLTTKMQRATSQKTPMVMGKMIEVSKFQYGLGAKVQNKNGQGPAGSPIGLIESIHSDIEIANPISLAIYEDKNANSGLYYYLPKEYHLVWEAGGYGMTMDYFAAVQEGQAGDIMIITDLHAGIGVSDLQLIEELLKDYTKEHGKTFKELLPLPLKEKPKASFVDDLNKLYNIPADKTVVHSVSDVLGRLRVSWVTDSINKENMQVVLLGLGLQGTVTFLPAGSVPNQDVVASIHPAVSQTFGEIVWNRSQQIRNETPYSLQFNYLNVLIKEKDTKEPVFYSWNLGETKVIPQAAVQIKATSIPSWIDGKAMRKWIEYDVIDRTEEQDETVIQMMTGGVFSLERTDIVVNTTNAFSGTGAYHIIATIRSKYFEPQSKDLITKKVVLKEDFATETIPDVIYFDNWEHRTTETDPLFEFNLKVIMQDSKIHTSDKWIPFNDIDLYIGTSVIKDSLGFLPGTDGGA
ncbi:MAG: hypothetical protein JXM79_20385 [Sedimentisphaerales bacterium]|nr:hypothetical protein [Sedimentisphaerales bacterium]